ncbi:hypothetical protein Y032_0180g757, partial [Ancylostoma ceylanicum]
SSSNRKNEEVQVSGHELIVPIRQYQDGWLSLI